MKNDINIQITKSHLFFAVLALAVILLLFYFFNTKSVIQVTPQQDISNEEAIKEQSSQNQSEELTNQLMGEGGKLPYETAPYFRSMVSDFFNQISKENYLIKADFDKTENKLTLYLDSAILEDEMAETWITGLSVQVMGDIKNIDDFILKYGTNESTGEYDTFGVYGVPSGVISQLPSNMHELSPDAVETYKNGLLGADTLDLVIQGKIFAHFENGKVFHELERLGLIGLISEGRLFTSLGNSKIEVMTKNEGGVFYFPNLRE